MKIRVLPQKTLDSDDPDNIAGDIKTRHEAEDASISSDEGSEVEGFYGNLQNKSPQEKKG